MEGWKQDIEEEKTPEQAEGLEAIYHATLISRWGNEIPRKDMVLDRNFFGWDKPDASFMLGATRSETEMQEDAGIRLNKGMFIKVIACPEEIRHAPDSYIEAGKTLRFVGIQGTKHWQSTYGDHEAPIVTFITDKAIEFREKKNKEQAN